MNPSSTVNNPRSANPDVPRFEVFVPAQAGPPPANGRLGVLGGAYNPITRAHLLLARYSREQAKLDEVIFVLSRVLPNKPLVEVSVEQRLEMMRLGSSGTPYISLGVCSHGLFLDICIALQQIYPQKPEIFFITGRDAAERILTWPYPNPEAALEQMFKGFQMLVFPRQGKPKVPDNHLIEKHNDRIHILRLPENIDQISSTRVRRRLSGGQPIDELVTPEVASYIIDHELYKNQSD